MRSTNEGHTQSDASVTSRFKNPWPRLVLASGLLMWGGANVFNALARWNEINNGNDWNRGTGMLLTLLVTALPITVGIFLVWTVVITPEDLQRQEADAKRRSKKGSSRSR